MAACCPSRCLRNSGREPNGQLLRYSSGDLKPREDFGTDELGWRKGVAAGTESLEKVEKHGYQEPAKKAKQREDADLTQLGYWSRAVLSWNTSTMPPSVSISCMCRSSAMRRSCSRTRSSRAPRRGQARMMPSKPFADDICAIHQYGLTQMSPPDSRLICRSYSDSYDIATV